MPLKYRFGYIRLEPNEEKWANTLAFMVDFTVRVHEGRSVKHMLAPIALAFRGVLGGATESLDIAFGLKPLGRGRHPRDSKIGSPRCTDIMDEQLADMVRRRLADGISFPSACSAAEQEWKTENAPMTLQRGHAKKVWKDWGWTYRNQKLLDLVIEQRLTGRRIKESYRFAASRWNRENLAILGGLKVSWATAGRIYRSMNGEQVLEERMAAGDRSRSRAQNTARRTGADSLRPASKGPGKIAVPNRDDVKPQSAKRKACQTTAQSKRARSQGSRKPKSS